MDHRLKSIEEFHALRERLRASQDPTVPTLVIPAGTCGQASGANDLIRVAKRELLSRKLADEIRLRITGCHGFCETEPCVVVEPRGTYYPRVGPGEMERIIRALSRGEICEELLYVDPDSGERIERKQEIPFFRRQGRTLLSRGERIDPIRIYHYILNGGYSALAGILARKDPAGVREEVKASGLRGRGGAGFPTGLKWEMLSRQPDGRGKILVCNADEGDPGAYMDRSLLEGNPHSIIEGMAIGAFATGADEGIVYVRDEYPLAIKHLLIALRQARELGLLGEKILGTGFSFSLGLVRGAGAFVCGEETALIQSVEGRMGEPRQRPPFPVEKGIDGKPTAINNVETWANIPVLFEGGAAAFRRQGSAGSPGTKIFSLVGRVRNMGLVEVPLGTSIREIVYEIGGGPRGRGAIKAVQTGGPSGGCIPAEMFDLPVDYDSLAKAGAIMGSGGMIVADADTCMVDLARYYLGFLKGESCGKCFPCRKGTQRMHEILDDICRGKGTREHLELLEELALAVKDAALCGLGQTASNPVLSTLRYFREETLEHVVNLRCPAGVCRDLVGAPCQSACPLGTEAWRYVAHIQRKEYEEAYRVIRAANPFPSVCARVCHHPCEEKCRLGSSGSQPLAIRALKRFITDRVPPSAAALPREAGGKACPVAVVGAGPAGLTAAHLLSLRGYRVSVFESAPVPGGMLASAIPAYRLPREVLRREVESLLNDNLSLHCGKALGRDFSVEDLMASGFKAVFLATGAGRDKDLRLGPEYPAGVFRALEFLRAHNLEGRELARGRVGVIGGGNAAVDAARVARRQRGVESVAIVYRRTLKEMPAFAGEVRAAIQEGIRLEPLTTPVELRAREGKLTGILLQRNRPGEREATGRRRPVPIPGTEFDLPLDTLIIAVGEAPQAEALAGAGVEWTPEGTVRVDAATLETGRPGLFAGGDLATGPGTVVEAIAAGKRAALMIDRYLRGEALKPPVNSPLPDFHPEGPFPGEPGAVPAQRFNPRHLPAEERVQGFAEVESCLSPEEASGEAQRCLRCDLEFTRKG